jgi:hypothetical protein
LLLLGFLERHASPGNFPNQKLPRPRIELTHKVNVPGTEGLIAEPGPSDHLEVVHPVDRYEVPVIHWYEMPVIHWYEMPVVHWHEMPVIHWHEMPVVHWYEKPVVHWYEVPVIHWYEIPVVHWHEMPVLHMKRAPVEMLELPALLWLPTDQNGRVRILIEAATADCLQGEAACQKPRDQEQELLEDTHSATSDGPPPH